VCAVHWLRLLIEPVVNKAVAVEMVNSVAQGGQGNRRDRFAAGGKFCTHA